MFASYIFYAWWDWRFLALIIINSVADYFLGLKISRTIDRKQKRYFLLFSILVNLGILGTFKYFNFFIDTFCVVTTLLGFQFHSPTLHIILPLGISFYTFKTLTYTIDIYKNQLAPTPKLANYLLYVSFFPQLISGPIERAKTLLPQIETRRLFEYSNVSAGAKSILLGYFKKMVIADSASYLVDAVYNNPADYVGFPMVIATLFYAIQIYCDFSGYSDIAIGLGRILGFRPIVNFNNPYFATSITDFWKRWHISLSNWFRDYLFLPISYSLSRVFTQEYFFHIKIELVIYAIASSVTFVICGLWHGANWNFIIWGAIHGLFIILERTYTVYKNKYTVLRLWRYLSLFNIPLTIAMVVFAWIFFRAASLGQALYIISNMFSDISHYTNIQTLSLKFRGIGINIEDIVVLCIFIGVLFAIEIINKHKNIDLLFHHRPLLKWCFYYFLVISILFWGTHNTANNFIYFQF